MYSPSELEDVVEVTGRVRLQLLRADGSEHVVEVDNLVLSVGKTLIANRMLSGPSMGPITHMCVGTGNIAVDVGQVSLQTEIARVALTNTAVAAAVITYTASFGPGVGTGALVEAGLANAAAAGTFLARTVYAVINKAAGDTLNVTWTVTIG